MPIPCSHSSACTSSEPACCPRPSQPETSRPRRRKVMLGGGLVVVLCCCSLATLALAGPPQHRRGPAVGGARAGAGAGAGAVGSAAPRYGFVRPASIAGRGSGSGSGSHVAAARLAGRSRQLPSPAKSSSSALWVSYTGTPPPSPASSPAGFVSFNHSSAAVAITEAAPSMPLPPSQSAARPSAVARPANLPGLSKEDLILLRAGQRVQHQIRNGCMGSGYVVVDVLADSKTVWETLLNFERYAEMIPTIRRVRVTSRPWKGVTKGLFTLSKFRFRLSVVHKHRPEENRLDFFLDPDSTQYRSILEMAEGSWYIDDRPADRPPGWTRVYMSATVKVNSLVPVWLVEYAAERALKRATSWLKPWVEQRAWEKQGR